MADHLRRDSERTRRESLACRPRAGFKDLRDRTGLALRDPRRARKVPRPTDDLRPRSELQLGRRLDSVAVVQTDDGAPGTEGDGRGGEKDENEGDGRMHGGGRSIEKEGDGGASDLRRGVSKDKTCPCDGG